MPFRSSSPTRSTASDSSSIARAGAGVVRPLPDDGDPAATVAESAGDLGEGLRRPPPPRVGRARVQHDERLRGDRQRRLGVPDVGGRQRQSRLDGDRRGADERDHLEETQHLVLVIDVADRPVQRRRPLVAGAGGDTGVEALHERVGGAAAAVELDGEVVALGTMPPDEVLDAPVVHLTARDQVRVGRDRLDDVPGPGPTLEKLVVPGQAEIGDAGVGIGRAERLERRNGDDEVTDAVRAEHDDAPDVVHQRSDRPERTEVQGGRVGDDLGRQRLRTGRLAGERAHDRSPLLGRGRRRHTSLARMNRSLWTRHGARISSQSMLGALWSDWGRPGARGAETPTAVAAVVVASVRSRCGVHGRTFGDAADDVLDHDDGHGARTERKPDARTTGS